MNKLLTYLLHRLTGGVVCLQTKQWKCDASVKWVISVMADRNGDRISGHVNTGDQYYSAVCDNVLIYSKIEELTIT